MTPKEKANKLANAFVTKSVFDMTNEELKTARLHAKKQAKMCVDEIINAIQSFRQIENSSVGIVWWQEVKREIDALP